MIGSAEFKKEKTGSISISDTRILIAEKNKTEIDLIRENFRFEIKNPGFEGMHKMYNVLMYGAIMPHSGLNALRIYNLQEDYKFDILIENQQRLNLISELIKK